MNNFFPIPYAALPIYRWMYDFNVRRIPLSCLLFVPRYWLLSLRRFVAVFALLAFTP